MAGGDLDDRPGADAPPPEAYEQALSSWGSWGSDARYGRFWRPSVGGGWQPFSDGRWVWTNWGWTWLSAEPWSWTFHYGRWSLLPSWGWAWFPGSVWSPAWVRWNTVGGYVGWAPWGYGGRPSFNQYVFVRDYDFCAPSLGRRVVRYDRLPRQALVHWSDHGGAPPPRASIERVGRHPLTVLGDRPSASLSPWDRNPRRRVGGADGPMGLDRGGRHRPGNLRAPDPGRGPLVIDRRAGRDMAVSPGRRRGGGLRSGLEDGGGSRGTLTHPRGGAGEGRLPGGSRGSVAGRGSVPRARGVGGAGRIERLGPPRGAAAGGVGGGGSRGGHGTGGGGGVVRGGRGGAGAFGTGR